MKILVSSISPQEAEAAWESGADIVDLKNVGEGSLGASFPWILRETVTSLRGRDVALSATLGDLPFKPGTASLAALGAATCGVDYVKAGLHGVRGYEEALSLMKAVVRSCHEFDRKIKVVAVGYADFAHFSGISPRTLVRAAQRSGSDAVMLDTARKAGGGLFDLLTLEALTEFVAEARTRKLWVGLAGSIGIAEVDILRRLEPDVVGVRGTVCEASDRNSRIDPARVKAFVEAVRPKTGVEIR